MDRRGFLSLAGLGIAGVALDQAIPFNRVWSFPKKIVTARRAFNLDGYETSEGGFIPYRDIHAIEPALAVGDIITIAHLPRIFPAKYRITGVREGVFSLDPQL
jgi:hypothetical protein